MIRIGLKSKSVRPCPDICRHATFHRNPCMRFWVILHIERQTDRQLFVDRAPAVIYALKGGSPIYRLHCPLLTYQLRKVGYFRTRKLKSSTRNWSSSCKSLSWILMSPEPELVCGRYWLVIDRSRQRQRLLLLSLKSTTKCFSATKFYT